MRQSRSQPIKDCQGPSLSWAPDGTALVFAPWSMSELTPPGSNLYHINADGTGLSVVPGDNRALDSAWRPE